MLAARMRRSCWVVLVLAGCNGVLPPPPPPRTRTAPEVVEAPATPTKPTKKTEEVPRTADSCPEQFRVKFETSKGVFVMEVHRDWSPRGADQFYKLVKLGFYDNCKFYRVVRGFMAQFGINGDPAMNEKYLQANIQDDQSAGIPNVRGKVTFAKAAQPNTRSTQIFINFGDNRRLDRDGFTPFGEIVEGMEDVVDELNGEYDEATTSMQHTIAQVGNAVLDDRFPNLDFIIKATILTSDGEPEAEAATPEKSAPEKDQPAESKEAEAASGQ